MSHFDKAQVLLREFKRGNYLHGLGVLPQVGRVVARRGKRAALVADTFSGSENFIGTIVQAIEREGIKLSSRIEGAAPNAPREDVARITAELSNASPDVIVSFGGGSTIDTAKAADVLQTLGGDIEDYFGVGLVSKRREETGLAATPHVAIQTAASSAAHLTKYSNITNVATGQKKLIVDVSVVPVQPVFDYVTTFGAPPSLTADGALDGVAHCLEVLYDSVGKPYYSLMKEVAIEGIRLVVQYLPKVLDDAQNGEAREALGLATDLGGYAIMLGGTNGAHLTSFSLVDILSHGRACAIMNPYYAVFFAPKIEEALLLVGRIFSDAGYTTVDLNSLRGRDLGMAVAEAMIAFETSIGFPATLGDVPGFSDAHIDRALAAAKNPQLRMKLENMPVPLTPENVDQYMRPVLQAAKTGDLALIRNA